MAEKTHSEFLKLEINARLEEYKALRAEIVATLGAAFQTTTLTLTAIGTLIASSPFIIKYERPVLFIAASYVFYILAWTQLRYGLVIHGLSQHIIEIISPGIQKALMQLGNQEEMHRHLYDVLRWEEQGRSKIHRKEKWTLPIEAARYGVPLGVGLLSSIAYLLNVVEIRP
jgi:hypothetical protein